MATAKERLLKSFRNQNVFGGGSVVLNSGASSILTLHDDLTALDSTGAYTTYETVDAQENTIPTRSEGNGIYLSLWRVHSGTISVGGTVNVFGKFQVEGGGFAMVPLADVDGNYDIALSTSGIEAGYAAGSNSRPVLVPLRGAEEVMVLCSVVSDASISARVDGMFVS